MRKKSRNFCELARKEIELGFKLFDEAMASESDELREMRLRHLTVACETAEVFLGSVPAEEADPLWSSQLAALKEKVETLSAHKRQNGQASRAG